MIRGIGIDSTEIDRFSEWHRYTHKQLSRIFSPQEIDYCLAVKSKSAERFAVRFAAREAFFKAFCQMYPAHCVPFLTLCASVAVLKNGPLPYLSVIWKNFDKKDGAFSFEDTHYLIHLSLTHTKSAATAIVVIEKHAD